MFCFAITKNGISVFCSIERLYLSIGKHDKNKCTCNSNICRHANTRGQPTAAYNDLLFPFYIFFALFALMPAPNCSFKVHSLHVVNYAYYRTSSAGLRGFMLLSNKNLKF